MTAERPAFDYRRCMACRICLYACPFGCLDETRAGAEALRKAYPELAKPKSCTGCGLCAKACPLDAIAMRAP